MNTKSWDTARSKMVVHLKFFAYLSFKLEHLADSSVPTACTNGKVVRYNPKFVESLTPGARITLIAHEIGHCVFSHSTRRGTRDPRISNAAADQEVDWMLEKMNEEARVAGKKPPFEWPPKELGHPAPDPKYRDWAYERIYDDMVKEAEKQPQPKPQTGQGNPQSGQGQPQPGQGQPQPGQPGQQGQGQPQPAPGQPGQGQPQSGQSGSGEGEQHVGSFGDVEDAPGGEAGHRLMESKWRDALASASKVCKSTGDLPGSLRKMIGQIIDPPISLEEQLRQFYLDRVREDYSWQTPNRRYAGAGFYLPSLDSRRMGEVVLACDSSGSILDKEWAEFVSLVNHVVADVMPARTTVIVCDAQIQQVTEFERGEEVTPGTVQNLGGGGTAFEPVFDHVENEQINPVCLIYFTDLEGSYPEVEPGYPVLWVTKTEGRQVPFGEIVRYP